MLSWRFTGLALYFSRRCLLKPLGSLKLNFLPRFLFSAGQNDVCDNSNAYIIVNWSLQSMKLLGHPALHFGEHLKNELPLPTFTPLKEWGKENFVHCGKRQKDKLFKLLLFRKNVSVCFNLDIWSELFHGYPKLSPLTTLGNCLQC